MKRFIALILGALLVAGAMAGCSRDKTEPTETEKDMEKTEETSEKKDDIENGSISADEIVEEESSVDSDKPEDEADYKTVDLSVYVSCDNATVLKREVRSLEVEDMRVGWAVLNALKESPSEEECSPAVSENIEFKKLVIKDKLAEVDFDDGGVGMGSAGDAIFIESVVLSLTKFPTVDKVRFTKNGEESPVLGNMVLDKDFDRTDISYSEVIE